MAGIRSTLLLALLLGLLVGSTACSSSPDERPGPTSEQLAEPLDLEEPTPTELADSPCGNPDWTRLPGGSAAPPAPQAPPAPEGPSTPPSAPPQGGDEQ